MGRSSRIFRSLLALSGCALCRSEGAVPEDTCAAGQACATSGEYYWPTARGRPESPTRSPYKGPKDLKKSLAWTWNHPEGQYAAILPAAPVIDDKRNLYLSTTEEIFSLDANGRERWRVRPAGGRLSDNPSIYNGALYSLVSSGQVFALDMNTGSEVWRVQAGDKAGGDIASVTAHDKRVFASVGMTPHGGTAKVTCLDAANGTKYWEITPETGLWNFIPMFPGDGNVVFQTENGDPYVVRISDGKLMWSKKRWPYGWTDGGTTVHNGIAYTVHAHGHLDKLSPSQPSDLTAYRVSDGEQLWQHTYNTPPNSWPAVAPMGEEKKMTVLFAYGGQAAMSPTLTAWGKIQWAHDAIKVLVHYFYLGLGRFGPGIYKWLFWMDYYYPWPGGVTAFEPETGKVRWEWKAPDWNYPEVKGDGEGLLPRMALITQQGKLYGQPVCIPNPWASPTLDSEGTMYLGFQDGVLYAVREEGGQGKLVDSLETTAAFSHPGAAMAPGMLAVANCDTLYVFQYAEE